MRRTLRIVVIAILTMVMTALPATGEEPFPPDDWQQTARFSGDYLYASFEAQQDGFRYISINSYDGSFKLPGMKGRGIQDELVSVFFDMGSCDPVTGLQAEVHLLGSQFTGDGAVPVYDSDTQMMSAGFALAGIRRVYQTEDCSWENRTHLGDTSISAALEIDGQYVTTPCKRKCFAVCEFIGTMELTYEDANLLEGITFDTVSEGFGGSRRGDIFWWTSP